MRRVKGIWSEGETKVIVKTDGLLAERSSRVLAFSARKRGANL